MTEVSEADFVPVKKEKATLLLATASQGGKTTYERQAQQLLSRPGQKKEKALD